MSTVLSLAVVDGEPRIDSRIIANELGVAHKNARALIDNYLDEFHGFALLPFETEAVKREGERGIKHESFYLLNEDQTYFLMTLVRNTPEAVELKKRLVKAFAQYRTRSQSLPEPAAPRPNTITLDKDEYIGLLKTQAAYWKGKAQPGRRLLTTEEKTRIKKFHAQGLGSAVIGQRIQRPEGTVGSYLRRLRIGQDR
ncbi:MAG: Rha family transcriptional regulator [Candidatus Competibacter denitrificans]